MNDQIDDGGPAFPQQKGVVLGERAVFESLGGMSLRDYTAVKAMTAELLTAGAADGPAQALARAAMLEGRTPEQQIAFNAYSMADAMMAARKNGRAS